MRHSTIPRIALSAATLLCLCACDRSSGGGPTSSIDRAPAPEVPQGPGPAAGLESPAGGLPPQTAGPADLSLDDAAIAGVWLAVHRRLAQVARLAGRNALDADVIRVANDSLVHHTDEMGSDDALLQRLSLTATVSPTSWQVDQDTRSALEALRGEQGRMFDRDYVDWQIRALNDTIQLFDRMAVAVKSPEIKAELARERTGLVEDRMSFQHLAEDLPSGVTNMQGASSGGPY